MRSPELQADREVVLVAVQESGDALEYASKELSADREVVLAAVKQDGDALFHAAPELRADKEVVIAAVKQDGSAPVCIGGAARRQGVCSPLYTKRQSAPVGIGCAARRHGGGARSSETKRLGARVGI